MKNKTDLSLKLIENIIQNFSDIEIYGFNDCLHNFYQKGDKAENVFKNITQSQEDIIQFSIQPALETSIKKLLSTFQNLTRILSKN